MLLIPEAAGPHDPVRATPARPPRSIRRTSNIDTSRPDGLAGELTVTARSRDLFTGPDGGASVLGEAGLAARVSGVGGPLLELSSRPRSPAGALTGTNVGPGFRARVAESGAFEQGSLLHLLLDDLPGAVLVSGYAVQRAGGFDHEGPSEVPEQVASRARSTMAAMGDDRCAGWAHDATMMVTIRQRGVAPVSQGPPAPGLERADDPSGWHAMEALTPHAMRRRRRLDLVAPKDVGAPYRVDAHFRDSHVDAAGEESVLHEYTLSGTLDPLGEQVLDIAAEARVLPWTECPRAAASAGRVRGMAVGELRGRVRRELVGVSTCTHLNDMLRSLDDLAVMVSLLHDRTHDR